MTIGYQPALEPGDPTIYKWTCPHEGCDGEGTFYLYGEFLGSEAGLPRFFEKTTRS